MSMRIGGNAGADRKAILDALQRHQRGLERMDEQRARFGEQALRMDLDAAAKTKDVAPPSDASEAIRAVDAQVSQADELVHEILSGGVDDFHEVAARLKQSDLSFKFALAVRNKLVDAYREVMRMSV